MANLLVAAGRSLSSNPSNMASARLITMRSPAAQAFIFSDDLKSEITKEDCGFVARCLNPDVASDGDTAAEAITNLHEALELYFEDPTPAATVDCTIHR